MYIECGFVECGKTFDSAKTKRKVYCSARCSKIAIGRMNYKGKRTRVKHDLSKQIYVAYSEPKKKLCCCQKTWLAIYTCEQYCPECTEHYSSVVHRYQLGDDDRHLNPQG